MRFDALPTRVSADLAAGRELSVSRETDRGPKPTLKVASAPRKLGPKLSKSLFNGPPPVSGPVGFGVRKQPAASIVDWNQPSGRQSVFSQFRVMATRTAGNHLC